MTDKQFSKAVWGNYVNDCANNKDNHHDEDQIAVRKFVEKTIRSLGCPNPDEVHDVVYNYNEYDLTPLAERIPNLVSGFMFETRTAFNLPAPNASTAPATLKVRAVDAKTKTGVVTIGPSKGKEYTSTTAAHEEVYVKNFTKAFKK